MPYILPQQRVYAQHPLARQTFHLLSARRLKLLKPTAFIVNTARGEIIDENALTRMLAQAQQLGANAVVNVRFATSSVAQGAAELFAYGTAVRVE